MKRLLSLIICTVLVFSAFAAVLPAASAARSNIAVTAKSDPLYSYKVIDGDAAEIVSYSGVGGAVAIPAQIDGHPVKEIGEKIFKDRADVTSVAMPDTVTFIWDSAFEGCTGLAAVDLSDSLIYLGDSAFRGCTGLTDAVLPDSVLYISDYAFYGCTGLVSIELSDGITHLYDYTFANCTALTSIDIPDNVLTVENGTFRNCTGLTSMEIPASVTYIGSQAFEGCTGLVSVDLPDSVRKIESYAFSRCESLTDIDFPEKLNAIDEGLFKGCKSLTSLIIPESVVQIKEDAFADCTGLVSVELGKYVETVKAGAFSGCTDLESITVDPANGVYDSRDNCCAVITKDDILILGCKNTVIPDSVTRIDAFAFCGCSGLTDIDIPDSVSVIGVEAFADTGLTAVEIPASVSEIGAEAFYGCTSLKSVTIPRSVKAAEIGDKAFGYYSDEQGGANVLGDCTVYGYAGSGAQEYADANGLEFYALRSETDEATGVSVDLYSEDFDIAVTPLTEQELDGADGFLVGIIAACRITAEKDGSPVQPDREVVIYLPCDENAKVFRRNADGSYTEMKLVSADNALAFETDVLGDYIIAKGKKLFLGDADGDGSVSILDATVIQRRLADLDVNSYEEAAADADGDGEIAILDATAVQRWLAELPTNPDIGKEIQV